MKLRSLPFLAALLALALPADLRAADPWLTVEGTGDGPGKGKHVVLVSGDEEYRSEEALPQLAKILAGHFGFKCTVLFAVDKADGTINPNQKDNIPGLESLKAADLMVVALRFRDLPDDQMKWVVEYLEAGKPVVGLRTSTHAFSIGKGKAYAKYSHNGTSKGYEKGFGKQVLGETWVGHYGKHGTEGTRGLVAEGQAGHPILRGIKDGDAFGTSDVYTINLPLPGDCLPLVYGEVTETLQPDSKPVVGKKNDVKMPVAWTKTYAGESGKVGRAFTTTMGASQDLASEGTRRLIVNGCLWAAGLEDRIPEKSNVDLVGAYAPTPFKFGGHKKGVKPSDLAETK